LLLARVGLSMDDIAVAKNHNPFAVNDAVFTKVTATTGASSIAPAARWYGPPQGRR